MTTAATVVALGSDGRSTDPGQAQWLFEFSDNTLCACWLETVAGDQRLRRALSFDGGVTWTRADPASTLVATSRTTENPLGDTGLAGLMLCYVPKDAGVAGNYIAGLNVMPKSAAGATYPSSQLIGMVYNTATRKFTDFSSTMTWAGTQPDLVANNLGNIGASAYWPGASSTDALFTFVGQSGGAPFWWIYLVAVHMTNTAISPVTDTRFQSGATYTYAPSMDVLAGGSAKVVLAYQRLATTNIYYRSYTYNGTTLVAGDAEEAVVTGFSGVQTPWTGISVVDATVIDVFYIQSTGITAGGNLRNVRRTGVGAWAAPATIATNAPIDYNNPDEGLQNPAMIFPIKNANNDLWVIYKSVVTQPYGELYWVRRNNLVWSATPTLYSGGSPGGRSCPTPFAPNAANVRARIHLLWSLGALNNGRATTPAGVRPNWLLMHDIFDIGVPDAPTNVLPATTGVSTLTPTITGTYNQKRAGDNLGKYRVQVTIHGGASVWDTGAGGTAWGGAAIAPGGTFSIVYAGTALVIGTQYDLVLTFWDAAESYVGVASAVVNFTPNLPPSQAAVSITADSTNGKAKLAAYALAPVSGSTLAPALCDFWRALGSGAFSALKTGVPFTAPTTQTGFQAYRQAPNLGLARNLVPNAGFIHGAHGWTVDATASVVADSTSVTGYAIRQVATAANQYSYVDFPVEAGKPFSIALQMRADGVTQARFSFDWLDGSGASISGPNVFGASTNTAYTETTTNNNTAPGNARTVRLRAYGNGAGVFFWTAIRVMQQAGACAAWTAAHQQYITRGLAIYEASTNLAADGDMEAVGTASWTGITATLAKDTATYFAGAKSLKVTNTAINGSATQFAALAAAQPITVSVRAKSTDLGTSLHLISTPSNTNLGTVAITSATDWNTLRLSGTIPGGDTGWQAYLGWAAANGAVQYFDNFAVENKAYDTMNADPSGQAFALAGRTASNVQMPIPAGLDYTDFAVVLAVRPDVIAAVGKFVVNVAVDANNQIYLSHDTNNAFNLYKFRGGVISATGDGVATNPTSGDTVAVAMRFSTVAGLAVWTAKNGGAVTKYNGGGATPEALLPVAGAPAIYLGQSPAGANQYDGTIGVLRILKAGLTDAQIAAIVAAPYQQPTDNDLAVWQFEGFTSQVPTFDDRLIALGSTYSYKTVDTAAAATPTQATSQVTSASVAGILGGAYDPFWLRDALDATKDVQLRVAYDGYSYKVERAAQISEPLIGGPKQVIYAAAPFGTEGDLVIEYITAADRAAKETALRALLASNDDIYLQDPFGALLKVRISAPVDLVPSITPTTLRARVAFVEAA